MNLTEAKAAGVVSIDVRHMIRLQRQLKLHRKTTPLLLMASWR